MTGRVLWSLAFCVCAASAMAADTPPPQARSAAGVSTEFSDRVQAFVTLRTELDHTLSAMKSTPDSKQIADHEHALAEMLIARRRDARQGDIFTPGVAKDIREAIRKAFRGSKGRSMRRTILEGDPVRITALRVNDVYPDDQPLATMPPTLLSRLPPLPKELAYRIVGRELVLKDVATSVIVDVIPNAIPGLH